MTIYENFLLDNMLLTLLTKLHVIKVERAQTKSSNGAIGYSRNDPSAGYIVQLVGDLDWEIFWQHYLMCAFYDGPMEEKFLAETYN